MTESQQLELEKQIQDIRDEVINLKTTELEDLVYNVESIASDLEDLLSNVEDLEVEELE